MTVQKFIASGTQKSTDDLIHAFERTSADKRDWAPEGARTARNVLAECAVLADGMAGVLAEEKFPENLDYSDFARKVEALDTDGKAISALSAATAKLVDVINSLPDDQLENQIVSPWGSYSTATWASHVMSHNSYHEGQINYIQTLYGDKSVG